MSMQPDEWHWLDARETISMQELCRTCLVTQEELDELVGYGALAPAAGAPGRLLFRADCVAPLRAATRLRRDYDLDLFTVALLVGYLARIEALEHQVRTLQAQLPAHVQSTAHEGPAPWREPHAKAQAGP